MNSSRTGLTDEHASAPMGPAHTGVLRRIEHYEHRCRDLHQWAVHPHSAEPGSALDVDDAVFAAAYPLTLAGPQAVTEHTLLPALSAVENLHGAGLLIEPSRPHTSAVLQLCRAAMESAALSIWLLADPRRELRLERCIAEEMDQLEQRRRYLVIAAQNEANRGRHSTSWDPAAKTECRRTFNAALETTYNRMFERAKASYAYFKAPFYSAMIQSSARWLDAHNKPGHDRGVITEPSMEAAATAFYAYSRSVVHGYKWMTEYVHGGTELALIADGLAAAVAMTEGAVCLYEAASVGAGGVRPAESCVPARLEPTIAAWTAALFGA